MLISNEKPPAESGFKLASFLGISPINQETWPIAPSTYTKYIQVLIFLFFPCSFLKKKIKTLIVIIINNEEQFNV